MNDQYHEILSELRTQMAEEYKTVRKSVNRPAWPQLMITKGRSRTEYLAVTYKDGKRIKRHINKEPGQIYRLAHKAYMKEYALRLRADMEVINAAVKAMQSLDYRSILKALPKNFDLLDPDRVMIPLGNVFILIRLRTPFLLRQGWCSAALTPGSGQPSHTAKIRTTRNTKRNLQGAVFTADPSRRL